MSFSFNSAYERHIDSSKHKLYSASLLPLEDEVNMQFYEDIHMEREPCHNSCCRYAKVDLRFDFRLSIRFSICSSIRFLNVDLLYDSIFRSHFRCNLTTWAARASFRALLEVLERYCDSERAEICTAIQRARALRSELEHKDSERYIIQ